MTIQEYKNTLLGMSKVLDYIGVNYKVENSQEDD